MSFSRGQRKFTFPIFYKYGNTDVLWFGCTFAGSLRTGALPYRKKLGNFTLLVTMSAGDAALRSLLSLES